MKSSGLKQMTMPFIWMSEISEPMEDRAPTKPRKEVKLVDPLKNHSVKNEQVVLVRDIKELLICIMVVEFSDLVHMTMGLY